jgi:hypothetical protein
MIKYGSETQDRYCLRRNVDNNHVGSDHALAFYTELTGRWLVQSSGWSPGSIVEASRSLE